MKQFIKDKVREQLLNEVRIPFSMNLPADILGIKDVFKSNGYSLYVVGGAVRDFLLNVKIKDFDLATDAVPDSVERIMQEAGYRTLATGKSFGVINVYTDSGEYEIATFRTEVYTDAGSNELNNFLSFLKSRVSEEKITEFKNKIMK